VRKSARIAGISAVLGFLSATSLAEPVKFDIPAQDLASALIAFSNQSHIQVTVGPDAASGRTAPAVAGAMEPTEALQRLIGNGLSYEFVDPKTVVVRRLQRASMTADPPRADPPPPGQALEEIVVTATKTGATALQSTPIAITSFTSRQLDTRAIDNITGLVSYTPGLQISDLSGYAQLYIRGVGSNTVYIGSDPSTTVHLDGVYLARPLSYFTDFLDVEDIEVLRGPQGTLYGRNSVGGTILINSRKPSETPGGELQISVGNYGEYSIKGYITGPIADTGILGSLAVNRLAHDAYLYNISTGGGVEDQDTYGFRGQLLFPITDRGSLTVRADYSKEDDALGAYPKLLARTFSPLDNSILGDFHKVSMNLANETIEENYGFAADLKYQITDDIDFRSLSAFRSFRGSIMSDADSSALNFLHTTEGPIAERQYSEEVNLHGKFDALDLFLGGFYFRENDREPLTVAIFPPIFPVGVSHIQRPTLEDESYALFGQGEYHLTDQLSLIAGIRWTHESKDYRLSDFWTISTSFDPAVAETGPLFPIPAFNVNANRSASAWTPKFGINYKPVDNILLYVSATRGFKSGGFDYGAPDAIDASRGYSPEYLWSYEIGAKTDWLDRRLRLNVDGFYYDYTDLQVELFVPPANAITENAATAEVKGIEAEFEALPLPELNLFLNVAYLDATYSKYPAAFTTAFGAFDASGKFLNHAPEWSITVGGTYTWDIGDWGSIYAGADFHFQTTEFFTPANDGVNGVSGYIEKQGPFGLLNARIGWDSEDRLWGAAFIMNNLTDRDYITGTASYGAAIAGRPGDPRTFRAEVTRKF